MDLKTMTKDERSLLLFFETCAVDQGGAVRTAHMNKEDMDITKKWDKEGLVGFGRICSDDILKGRISTHWVELSDKAFEIAHQERKARAERMWTNRNFKKTSEL